MKRLRVLLASLALAGISFAAMAAPVAQLTGPLDPSSMLSTLNSLITQINASIAAGTGAPGTPGGSVGDWQTNAGSGLFGGFTPGANVQTFITTPSSANLLAAMTTKTGTGNLVFATSPTLVTPVLGTPASGDATNLTNIPVANATGTLAFGHGGTGQTSYTDGQLLIGNSGTGGLSKATLTAGSNVTITNGGGTITIASTGGSGSPAGVNGDIQINSSGSFGALTPGTGVSTFLTTPSGANLAAALTSALSASKGGTGLTSFTVQGNTTKFTSYAGSAPATNDCAKFDANGNITTNGASCASGGLTLAGSAQQLQKNDGAGNLAASCYQNTVALGNANSTLATSTSAAPITATLTAPRTYTLALAANVPSGCVVRVFDSARTVSGSNTATIARQGSDTINGGTSLPAITTAGFWIDLASDGTSNWTVVNSGVVAPLQSAQIYVGNSSNITTPVAMSGDVSISNTGETTVGAIQGKTVPSGATTDGQLLIGRTDTGNWNKSTLTAGTGVVITNGTGTITPSLATGLAISEARSLVYKVSESNAGSTVTGVTAETKIGSCAIPANAMGATGSIRMNALVTRPTSQTSSTPITMRFGAANDLTGTSMSTGSSAAATRANWLIGMIYNRAANSQLAEPQFVLGSAGSNAMTTAAIDTSAQSFLVLSVTPATSGDSITLEALTCEVLPVGGN